MCGILFINSKKKNLNKKQCLHAFKTLESRGPDKQLYEFLNNKNFLGNSILSITGQVKKGSSLYNYKNNKLSFNGEIYNYKELQNKFLFKKNEIKSDTDLLIRLNYTLGAKKAAKSLNGMFAYCLFNKKQNTASFITDPQGEKKLFIYNNQDFFIASSTILAIKKFLNINKINYDVLNDYFATRHFLFFEKTIYKNLKVSRPGSIINYNIKNHRISKSFYFDCLDLIDKEKYNLFNKLQNSHITLLFERLIKKQLHLMIPERKFASIFSGGVDSSVISYLVSKLKKPNAFACLNHIKKDRTMSKTTILSKKLNSNFYKINISEKKYFYTLREVYKLLCHPFCTHDFVGRYLISNFFKKKKCKVYFVADGADELLGGYEKYLKTRWSNEHNLSPYTHYKESSDNKNSDLKKHLNLMWKKAYKKYKTFLNKKESSIQASLFADYFSQCVSVGNIGTDIMSGENSVEPRTVFIQKSIIEFALNLPLKHKINFKSLKKNLINKPILKEIFIKYFGNKYLFKKQGFPGFPNESFKYLSQFDKKKINKILNFFKNKNKNKNDKDFVWKILNIYYFAKYNNIKVDFEKIKIN